MALAEGFISIQAMLSRTEYARRNQQFSCPYLIGLQIGRSQNR